MDYTVKVYQIICTFHGVKELRVNFFWTKLLFKKRIQIELALAS